MYRRRSSGGRVEEAEPHASSSASSRKIGCIQAGASLRSFRSSRRLSAGSVRFRCSTPRRGHVLLAQLAKRLDQEAAQPARRLHVPRRRPPQLDRRRADLHRPARAVGQEDRFRRHLFGQAECLAA